MLKSILKMDSFKLQRGLNNGKQIPINKRKIANKTVLAIWKMYRTFLLFGLSVIILYPLMYSVSVAFRPVHELYDPLVIYVPRSLTLDNLMETMKYLDYGQALLNSVKLNLITTIIQLIVCSLIGYGLARYNFRGKGLVFSLVILTIIVPPQTIIIPNFINFRYFDLFGIGKLVGFFTGHDVSFNLINSNWSFYLPAMFGMGLRSGLFIFIFRQFFRGMPKDLEEAAYIDGCSQLKTYFKVMVPNAGPAFLTSFLFSIVWYWNDFVYTSTYLANAKTVMYQLHLLTQRIGYILQYEKQVNPYEGIVLMQSGVILGILPLLIIYVSLQKYFTESIERSGIVG
ncbi:carbohydrate ABC transporter permease [Paenibacillus alkalitolerans]|uniref:carbohydrate ABC transporter permease n=1 Tax=Paenibacillus alkalitolerans TaxID=2799335 RepID=UPI0018F57317|nr:carbohydrate ABC transporter permease [Paenibacillus alkalitolerans]